MLEIITQDHQDIFRMIVKYGAIVTKCYRTIIGDTDFETLVVLSEESYIDELDSAMKRKDRGTVSRILRENPESGKMVYNLLHV